MSSDMANVLSTTPRCYGMAEIPEAATERANLLTALQEKGSDLVIDGLSPMQLHLAQGLALTVGSALGSKVPDTGRCLSAFQATNQVGLGVGARAWTKHAHRSQFASVGEGEKDKRKEGAGWWGKPSGPVSVINENALRLFWRIMNNATWRNLHWLPHSILVYEVRVEAGYGMRWYQYQGQSDGGVSVQDIAWTFRGFVEPMMENGHELGWRHAVSEAPAE